MPYPPRRSGLDVRLFFFDEANHNKASMSQKGKYIKVSCRKAKKAYKDLSGTPEEWKMSRRVVHQWAEKLGFVPSDYPDTGELRRDLAQVLKSGVKECKTSGKSKVKLLVRQHRKKEMRHAMREVFFHQSRAARSEYTFNGTDLRQWVVDTQKTLVDVLAYLSDVHLDDQARRVLSDTAAALLLENKTGVTYAETVRGLVTLLTDRGRATHGTTLWRIAQLQPFVPAETIAALRAMLTPDRIDFVNEVIEKLALRAVNHVSTGIDLGSILEPVAEPDVIPDTEGMQARFSRAADSLFSMVEGLEKHLRQLIVLPRAPKQPQDDQVVASFFRRVLRQLSELYAQLGAARRRRCVSRGSGGRHGPMNPEEWWNRASEEACERMKEDRRRVLAILEALLDDMESLGLLRVQELVRDHRRMIEGAEETEIRDVGALYR